MKEIWKDVIGFENGYSISNFGRIKSKERLVDYGWKKVIKKSKILSVRVGKYGYCYTIISLNKIRKTVKPHRLVAKAFIPNPNNLPQVNHKDGNKLNNHVNNLEWVSSKDNIAHAFQIGLKSGKKGELSHYAKLSKLIVEEIRDKYKIGNISQKELGKQYNISQSQVTRIVNNKNWKEYEETT